MHKILWIAPLCAAFLAAQSMDTQSVFAFQAETVTAERKARTRDAGERAYERGQAALERNQWDKAVEIFSAIPKDSERIDAALYWKAYALNRLGRRPEALSTLGEIQSASRWLNDAKALAVEIQQAGGQSVSPESQSNEELKLLAINSLIHSDPERAIPLLRKVLQGAASPQLKDRALFVLAQSGSPQARQILAEIAKGQGNPDLQPKAVRNLGLFGGKDSRQTLGEIYASSTDPEVKRSVLKAYMLGHDCERLLSAGKQEVDAGLRLEAIRLLGVSHCVAELGQLYSSSPTTEAKKAILGALFVAHATEQVGQLARTEKDPAIRADAIHKLGLMGPGASPDLAAIYSNDSDKSVRKAVIKALFLQHNATALVDLGRKENDPELKQDIVRVLSLMHSKEATEFMTEILNK